MGTSVEMGARRQFTLDANLSWTDFCPGGLNPTECGGRDAPILSIVGLDQDAELLFEGPVYRGRSDAYGLELWGRYAFERRGGDGVVQPTGAGKRARSKPNVALDFGAGFMSPAIRPSAITANDSYGWMLNGSIGAEVELRQRAGSVILTPGYGIDVLLPVTIGPGGRTPLYSTAAADNFAATGGDINGPGAKAVLQGRGRPSNGGRYVGASHLLTLTVRWAERDPERRQ